MMEAAMKPGENQISEPKLFDFLDYRKYLQAYYLYKKSQNQSFSYKVFSQRCQVKSSCYIKHIITGIRNLPLETIPQVAAACKMSPAEINYFTALVRWNQSKDDQERSLFWAELLKCVPQEENYLLNSTEARILSKWYMMALLEMLSLKDFRMNYKWIQERFSGRITADQIKESFEFLLKVKLVKKEGDKYLKTNKLIFADPKDYSELVKSYYAQLIPQSIPSLLHTPSNKREFAASTMTIREEDILLFKKKIQDFHQELIQFFSRVEEGDQVYQFSLQFYPLTASEKKDIDEAS